MDKKIKTWPLRFPAKENPNMEKASVDFWKFSDMKFFHPSVRLTNQKPRVYTLDKPIKSLYFRSFLVSVTFTRFHFKDIRKPL